METYSSISLEDWKAGKGKRMTEAEAKAALAKLTKEEIEAMEREDEDFEGSLKGAKYVFRGSLVGRPRKEETQDVLTIRLPASKIAKLKATGKGWSTRVAKYIEEGIAAGLL